MTYVSAGRALLLRHCSVLSACGETRFFLNFEHDLHALEMVAIRDFVVEHFSSPDRHIFFNGAWPIETLSQTSTCTRMIFLVRDMHTELPYIPANQNGRTKLMDALLREMASFLRMNLWAQEGLWFKPNKISYERSLGSLA